MISAFFWQNSVNLCPASFCSPRLNLPVTPRISWLRTFAFQSPTIKRTSFGVLVLEGLVGLHRTIQLQLLQRYLSGHRLGLLWYWMVCFGNRDHSVVFEIASKHCISDSLVDYGNYSISSKVKVSINTRISFVKLSDFLFFFLGQIHQCCEAFWRWAREWNGKWKRWRGKFLQASW